MLPADCTLIVSTGKDVVVVSTKTPSDWLVTPVLSGVGAQTVTVDRLNPHVLYAGTFDQGVWRSLDGGATWTHVWQGPQFQRVLSVAVSPSDRDDSVGVVYAGTEPSALFVSRDAGQTWHDLESLRTIPSAPTWSFPPRPWTSHVRWIGLSYQNPDLILAGIELGGVMRSTDRGRTWQDHRPGAVKDCHSLAWSPAGPVYEAGGSGVARSDDQGETWRQENEGLGSHRYAWSVVVDPANPDLAYLSAATGPSIHSRRGGATAGIYRRRADGSWLELGGGLPSPMSVLAYALALDPAHPDRLYAGLGDGTIWFSADAGDRWKPLPIQLDDVTAMVVTE